MRRYILPLSLFVFAAGVACVLADDEIIMRSKDKPYRGVIKGESVRGVEIKGKEIIPAESIVDIVYEVTPVDMLINLYRPALQREKDYYDPDPKKDAKRKANLDEAIKKLAEAYPKINEKNAKRHIEYKLAVLSARHALDNNESLEPAIKRLSDYKLRNPDSWQITACLQLLGKLQLDAKKYQDADATYQELAKANVPEDIRHEAELSGVHVAIKAGKFDAAQSQLQKLVAKLPANSKFQGRAKVAQAECLLAAKKDADAVALLRKVAGETKDKDLKALAYNALGSYYYGKDQLKEARWEFLWVDVVYNQDQAEHAKATLLSFQNLRQAGPEGTRQECREALLADRAYIGMEWQRLARNEK